MNNRTVHISTLRALCSTRSRCSLSLSRGSLTLRTNERLYSSRPEDLWSAEVDRPDCSSARYRSPRESACMRLSRGWPKQGAAREKKDYNLFTYVVFRTLVQTNRGVYLFINELMFCKQRIDLVNRRKKELIFFQEYFYFTTINTFFLRTNRDSSTSYQNIWPEVILLMLPSVGCTCTLHYRVLCISGSFRLCYNSVLFCAVFYPCVSLGFFKTAGERSQTLNEGKKKRSRGPVSLSWARLDINMGWKYFFSLEHPNSAMRHSDISISPEREERDGEESQCEGKGWAVKINQSQIKH